MTDPMLSTIVQTDDVSDLYADFVKAFGELRNVATDAEANTGTYSYKYMTLGAIVRAIREPLSTHGLAIIQAPAISASAQGRAVDITTRLIHSSGQWMESVVSIGVAAQANAQAIGSAITYGRRYGLTAMLGIASGDDDDGGAASSYPPAATGYDDDLDIAGAKGVMFEALGRDKALAAAFWSEHVGADRTGPFPLATVEALRDKAIAWNIDRQRADGASEPEPEAEAS